MRRAVDKGEVVVVFQRRQQLAEAGSGFAELAQRDIQIAVAEVGRNQIEARVVGAMNGGLQPAFFLRKACGSVVAVGSMRK